MTFSIELPTFCSGQKFSLKFCRASKKNELVESKIKLFFSLKGKFNSLVNFKFYETSSFLLKIDTKFQTNIITKIKVCLKITKILRSNEFFDFSYIGSKNFKRGKILVKNFKQSSSMIQRELPIDLIPISFTQFSQYKNKFELDKKNYSLAHNNKFYSRFFIEEYFNHNPLGLDKRSVFSINSKNKIGFDFKLDLVPKRPNLNFMANLRLVPPFAIGFILRLYKHRPSWTKNIIERYIPIAIKKYLKKIFPLMSYKFKGNNPYKDVWHRFEFDPRANLKAILYKTKIKKKTG